ncbi:MAG: fibronectin type III domain-containing protein [Flavobacterium sp.]
MKKPLHLRTSRALLLLLGLMCYSNLLLAQSTANYAFTTNTTASLVLDLNSNTVDMTTGTTQIHGASVDDTASPAISIGFDFFFYGSRYTDFSVSDNGLIGLGTTAIAGNTYVCSGGSTTTPRLSGFCADLRVGTSGKIHYKIIGDYPNRCLVIEFSNMSINYLATPGNDGTYQVRLYESTGVVEYVYGAMAKNAGSGTSAQNNTTIGFSVGSAANTTASVTTSTNTVAYTATFNSNPSYTVNSPITNLNSASNGSRRVYRFSPPTANAPTGLSFSNITTAGMTLNWTDNASNELGYVVYVSTDNVNFTFDQQLAQNSTSATVTGLTNNTLYYFKVFSIREGALSTALTGSQTTLGQVLTSSGSWLVPVGVTSVTAECWGAGGGGSSRTGTNAAGGGGGGAYSKGTFTGALGGNSITYIVGTGGAIGAPTAAPGNVSSASFGGNTVTANGGLSTNTATGGAGGTASAITGITTVSYAGGAGGTANTAGGGGGGSATSTGTGISNGTNGGTSATANTPGGTGQATGGLGAASDNGPAATAGSVPGSGGGGKGATGAGSSGVGGAGQVVFSWVCPTYAITGVSATTPSTTGTTSTVTVTGLSNGTYTVTYSFSGANANANQTASMTVSGGIGTFTTIAVANAGATTITVTNLSNGTAPATCSNAITENNSTIISINSVTYNTAGTSSFTIPAGITCVKVDAIGGGAGGSTRTSNSGGAGGGGGGAFASGTVSVVSGNSYTVVVGAGGATNANGGDSTFNSTSVVAEGGFAGASNTQTANSGGTVAGSTGNIARYKGGDGGAGGTTNSGAGGGGAGTTGAGGNATTTTAGTGTASGGGNGAAGVTAGNTGNTGNTYGGGGSGGAANNGTDRSGGAGARGLVTITWIDASDFSTTATAAVCANNPATVTVTSTTLDDGTYTVTYNTTNPTTTGNTATMVFSGVTGTFTTINLLNATTSDVTANITITGVTFSGWSCGATISTGNAANVVVNPNNTVTAGSNPTLCISTSLTPITHTTTSATGIGSATGLPSGVSASWASNVITISGTPSASGTFNYSIPLTGGCGTVNATGTITVTPLNTVGSGSATPTLCINTALTAITHTTTGATGISNAGMSGANGLPTGVSASWASNTITISGTPTASGIFNYSIPLTGGCGAVNATGTITVTAANTAGTASSNPTLCINTALTAITRTTTGATGISNAGVLGANGLPAGVSASWASNTITISGTPTASGIFNYSIPLTGGCGTVNATGTITVTAANTAGTASSNPTLCINTALTAITRTTTGATGISNAGVLGANGLPAGVSATWASNTITVSGTPTASGTFNYSIPLTGGCGSVNATGTITVTAANTAGTASSTPTLCINTALIAITHATTGATGISSAGVSGANGLPSGVSATWASNTITISGTPTTSGIFSYSIPLTGGCSSVNATGTITVTAANTAGTTSSNPTLCINTALVNITRTTTGATGISSAGVSGANGLPSGVSATWASNTITISGTPTASGTFNYSIPLTGGCGIVNATGTITVTAANTAGTASSTPTLCINTALVAITHTTAGATGVSNNGVSGANGLPAGVSASWASNTITISGTPTVSGTFNYSIPLTGGCGSTNATGTITVTAVNSVGAASTTPTLCRNTAMTAITHTTIGATGISNAGVSGANGLPSGVSASWVSNTITISGTPTVSGTFSYSIPLTGGCGSVNATGTITVNASTTAAVLSGNASVCSGSPTNLSVAVTGGSSPFDVVYTDGTSNFTVNGYASGSAISVAPLATTTYTLVSVTSANGCAGTGNSGSAVVAIDATTSTDGGATWSNGTPTSAKSAIFDGATGTIGADFNACSLRLKNNATVTVSSGFDVTLQGKLTVESGSAFTLSNNANLLQNTTVANSGNIIVKRNSSALKRLDYTLWSSPVAGQGLYAFSPTTLPNRFYTYVPSSNTYSASVGFNLTGLQYPSPLVAPNGINGTDGNNVQFATGQSYLIRVPWDHPTAATVWGGTFTGVPNNGDIPVTVSTAGEPTIGYGYNAVGNPYPSRINVHDFIDGNTNISGTLYFWRKTNDNTSSSYATLSKIAYVANGAAGGDTGTGYFNTGDESNWVINIGQGFFVKANSGSTISFTNSMRRSSNGNQFFRTSQNTDTVSGGLYWLNLTANTGIYSQMAVGYSSEGTLGVDRGIDGENINKDFYLTSLIDANEYSIQGRPDFNSDDIVPLAYKTATAGTYTISIDHASGIFSAGGQSIYLKDNLTSSLHDMGSGAYSFTTDAGAFGNRFEVVYTNQLGGETFSENTVVIYTQGHDFVVNSGNAVMSSIKVFDIRGRLLQQKTGINSSQSVIGGGLANQVLLVQITSDNGAVVTKKVIR